MNFKSFLAYCLLFKKADIFFKQSYLVLMKMEKAIIRVHGEFLGGFIADIIKKLQLDV